MKKRWIVMMGIVLIFFTPNAGAKELTLDEAFGLALRENPSLEVSKTRIIQAQERIGQARASFFPTLTLAGTVTGREMSDNAAAASQAGQERRKEYYSAGLSVQWVLFSGFLRRSRYRAAQLEKEQSQASMEDTTRLLLASIADSYFSAQLAVQDRAIAEADKGFNLRLLKEAEIKKEVGTGSLSDYLNFKIKVNSAETIIENSRYQYDISRAALAALLGMDDPGAALPKPSALASEKKIEMHRPDYQVYIDQALAGRPDIKSLFLAIEASKAFIKSARSDWYPSVTLTGDLGVDRTGSSRFENDDLSNSVSLIVSYPLFTGGKDRAELREALAAKKEVEASLKVLEVQVVSDVKQAVFKVISAQKQLKLQRETTVLVKRTRDLVEQEYLAGKTSLVRLNEVQTELTTAQGRLALSLVTLRRAWYQLKARTGSINSLDGHLLKTID